jgi:hypothetical protein
MAEDRPDCCSLYVVTNCKAAQGPVLQPPVLKPARLGWKEVKKVDHYAVPVERFAHAGDAAGGAS